MRIIFFIAIIGICSLFGCHDPASEDLVYTDRTIIVYLGVDNNFTGEDREKIESLTQGWDKNFQGRLLIYADPQKPLTGSGDGLPYLTEVVWEEGRAVAKRLKQYPEQNSASPKVFRQVLEEIIGNYPAASYGLIVLSHASGWLPSGTLASPRTIINDGEKDMELWDFAEAIPVKMDFIVLDACFMAGAEVVYELKDKTDYLISSPAEVLVPGFVYRNMMAHLMLEQPDVVAVARDFYDYFNRQSGSMRSATVSVFKMSALEPWVALSRTLLENINGEQQVDLEQIQRFGYGKNKLYFDLGDYIKALHPERFDEFTKMVNDCVIYKAHTPGYYSAGTYSYSAIEAYSGLTIYIPQTEFPYINSVYRRLKWTQRVNPYIPQ